MSVEARAPETYIHVLSGDLYIGELALADAIDSGHDQRDIVPVLDAIDNLDIIPESTAIKGMGRNKWSAEDCVAYGKWLSGLIKSDDKDRHVTEAVIESAYRLGLGPYQKSLAGKFGGKLWQFQDAIGENNSYARGRYSEWGTRDFVEYGRRVVRALHGKKPTTADFQRWFKNGKGPSAAYIRRRVGGVDALQELLGFPNINDWAEEDYIEYGVRVIQANPEQKLTRNVFDELSKRKRGPSTRSIVNHFGTLSKYKEQITTEHTIRSEVEKLTQRRTCAEYLSEINKGQLPIKLVESLDDTEQPTEFIRRVAKYKLIASIQSGMTPSAMLELSSRDTEVLVKRLVSDSEETLSPAKVEVKAEQLGVMDDMWPMEEYLDYLKIAA